MRKHDSDLFFCCSLIEFIGRFCKMKRAEVVGILGEDTIRKIYKNADILHCEPMEKTADVYMSMFPFKQGYFDNVEDCRYEVPDYWTIGEVYERLIEDIAGSDTIQTLIEVYDSFISDSISNYNSDFYYQSRDYIYECYRIGKVI